VLWVLAVVFPRIYSNESPLRFYSFAQHFPLGSSDHDQDIVTGNEYTSFDTDHQVNSSPSALYEGNGGAIKCSTRSNSKLADCPEGIGDFAVGQGIEIPIAGVAPAFAPWGLAKITGYSRAANVATYSYVFTGPTLGAGQTITVDGLSDPSFNGHFTVATNDGNLAHFSVLNHGPDVIAHPGSGTATLTSAQLTVSPQGVLNGSASYSYKVALRGYHGELSVASAAGTTTTGAGKLGVNAAEIISCSRKSGVATCTTSAEHNFQSGISTDVEGSSNKGYNGSHVISSTPTSKTFTFLQIGVADDASSSTGGSAKVVAKNVVRWNMQQYLTLQSIVYRSKNDGAYSVVGIVEGMDGSFVDWGLAPPLKPAYIPDTPPSKTTNGILAGVITGINGKTLTLSTAATATVKNQIAQHDNAPVVLAACAAMPASTGGVIRIPALDPPATIPFNSPLDFYHECKAAQPVLEIASAIVLNEPIIPKRSGLVVRAAPGSSQSGLQFVSRFTSQIYGNAYPFFYVVPGTFGPFTIENIAMKCLNPYQSCVVQDQDAGGGGVVDVTYDNDYFIGNGGSMPFILRSGGFNHWFDRGAFVVNTGGWGVPEALQITVPNSLGINPTLVGFPYVIKFDKTFWVGHGIDYNDFGLSTASGAGRMTFNEPLIESSFTPWLSLNLSGQSVLFGTTINNLNWADYRSGPTTPIIEATNASRIAGLILNYSACGSSLQPLLAGMITGGVQILQGATQGCSVLGTTNAIITNLGGTGNTYSQYQGTNLEFTSEGQTYYAMDAPTAPASLIQSPGGAVPSGENCYRITAFDINGGKTVLGPSSCIKTTPGNGTVTINRPSLPKNAVGWAVYWDQQSRQVSFFQLSCGPIPERIAAYKHNVNYTCALNAPSVTTAAKASVGSMGISGYNIVGSIYSTTTNCTSTSNPAPCANAPAGAVAIAPGATSVVVNTTAVTVHSRIQLTFDSSLSGELGVSCMRIYTAPMVSERKEGIGFTISVVAAPNEAPACYSYNILN